MKITWYGRACFTIEHKGYVIAIDPYVNTNTGYPPLHLDADMVLVSHEHTGHNNRAAVTLTNDSKPCPFTVEKVDAPHDTRNGIFRGMNYIHVITTDDGYKLLHTGDMGINTEHELLWEPDVLMMGCGSTRTMPSYDLSQFAFNVDPRIIIPMHYHHDHVGNRRQYKLEDLFYYLEGTIDINYYETNSIEITKETPRQVAVLKDIV